MEVMANRICIRIAGTPLQALSCKHCIAPSVPEIAHFYWCTMPKELFTAHRSLLFLTPLTSILDTAHFYQRRWVPLRWFQGIFPIKKALLGVGDLPAMLADGAICVQAFWRPVHPALLPDLCCKTERPGLSR